MKKLLFCLLMVLALFLLVGCNNDSNPSNKEDKKADIVDKDNDQDKDKEKQEELDTYETPIKNLCKAFEERDYSYLKDAYLPERLESYDLEVFEYRVETREEEYGKYTITTCELRNATRLNKEELNKANEFFAEEYETKGEITDAYSGTLAIKYEGPKDSSTEVEPGGTVIKINGKWYIAYIEYK